MTEKSGRPRGFAAMDPEKVRELAARGGKAAHAAGTAHEFTSAEAKVAGSKGGKASVRKRHPAEDVVEEDLK
jgi:general stress protein YciG